MNTKLYDIKKVDSRLDIDESDIGYKGFLHMDNYCPSVNDIDSVQNPISGIIDYEVISDVKGNDVSVIRLFDSVTIIPESCQRYLTPIIATIKAALDSDTVEFALNNLLNTLVSRLPLPDAFSERYWFKNFLFPNPTQCIEINFNEWIVNRGEYAGTLPKRISKYYYKKHDIKILPEELAQFGVDCTGSHNMINDTVLPFTINDGINWSSGQCGDSGSCFWGGRKNAKYMLMNAGGLAIKTYRYDEYWNRFRSYGRCWLYPMEEGLIIFNAYGEELINMARALSTILGGTYSKLDLANDGCTARDLYINSDSGYLIKKSSDVYLSSYDFHISEGNNKTCSNCGERMDEDSSYYINDEWYCNDCATENFTFCDHCNEWYSQSRCTYDNSEEEYLCDSCFDARGGTHCERCGNGFTNLDDIVSIDDNDYCEDCAKTKDYICCDNCGDNTEEYKTIGNECYCRDCLRDIDYVDCANCETSVTDYVRIENKDYYIDCAKEYEDESTEGESHE